MRKCKGKNVVKTIENNIVISEQVSNSVVFIKRHWKQHMEISYGDYLSQETSFLPSANIIGDRLKKIPKEKLLDLFLDCQERKDYRQDSEK